MVMQGLSTSIIGRAKDRGLLSIEAVNIRDYTLERHKKVDDYPYGGGAGMLMQAQPVYDAWKSVVDRIGYKPRTVYLTPQGPTFTQPMAKDLAQEKDLILLCGHFEFGIGESSRLRYLFQGCFVKGKAGIYRRIVPGGRFQVMGKAVGRLCL